MLRTAAAPGVNEWRNNWRIVLASAVGCGFAASSAITLGSFVVPLSAEFQWSRAEITTCLLIGALGTIFFTPLLGRAIDMFGARRIALCGVPAYALAVAGFGLAGASISSWYLLWGVFAVACMGMSPVVWTLAVARRFDHQRGLALAAVLSGMSIASAVLPMYAVHLIGMLGWRGAYWALAATILVISGPLTLFWFRDTREDSAQQVSGPAATQTSAPLPGLRLTEALKTSRFWRITLCLALVGGCYSAIYIHFQPLLIDADMSPEQAALLVGLIGPVAFAGRLLTGFLLDRIPAPPVATIAFALPIVSCLLLHGFSGNPVRAGIAIGFSALAAGAEIDMVAYLASRYFGMRSFGAIYGLIFSSHTIGWAIMPVIAGRSFDATGSYDSILTVMIFLLAVSALLAASLGRYPSFPGDAAPARPQA